MANRTGRPADAQQKMPLLQEYQIAKEQPIGSQNCQTASQRNAYPEAGTAARRTCRSRWPRSSEPGILQLSILAVKWGRDVFFTSPEFGNRMNIDMNYTAT